MMSPRWGPGHRSPAVRSRVSRGVAGLHRGSHAGRMGRDRLRSSSKGRPPEFCPGLGAGAAAAQPGQTGGAGPGRARSAAKAAEGRAAAPSSAPAARPAATGGGGGAGRGPGARE